jgi:quercetin dioxygenase-like cupin family protein
MTGTLCVLDPQSAAAAGGGIHELPGAGPDRGFTALAQTLLLVPADAGARRSTGDAEEVLFVVDGHGELALGADAHALAPESGACLAPGEEYELRAGSGEMKIVSVRVPDPEPAGGSGFARTVVRRLAEQTSEAATTQREFRIVADPSSGLRSATHFVGYIPPVRAPEHFHTYDEVIYVLEGEGLFHARGESRPVSPGTCIGLPARLVHCLENTGPGVMRVAAVFRPAGSPAAAYYPDGTPAFPGVSETKEEVIQ